MWRNTEGTQRKIVLPNGGADFEARICTNPGGRPRARGVKVTRRVHLKYMWDGDGNRCHLVDKSIPKERTWELQEFFLKEAAEVWW